jgi:REP element-mobilizing transposase RayT
MVRPLRIEFPGAVYHITSRGNAKEPIFLDDTDRSIFLDILDEVVKRFNWLCHTYCLMTNHYHMLIETPEGNLSSGMRQLNGVYTQRFNRRHGRDGHIFQGRYRAILVDKEGYLLSLCRYVVLNPVRAGIVAEPEEWRWSSYGAISGQVEIPSFLTVDWILSGFGADRASARKRYKEYVSEGRGEKCPWEKVEGQILLGREDFIKKIGRFLYEKEEIKEVPRIQRYVARPAIEELFKGQNMKYGRERDQIIYAACVRYGYRLKEVADYLGVHYSTISRTIRRVERGSR